MQQSIRYQNKKIIGGEIYELHFKTRRHSTSKRKGVFA